MSVSKSPKAGLPSRSLGEGWFFDDPAKVDALYIEAESWKGTPFREYSKAKGKVGGVDCNGLLESIMVALGACEPFTFPWVPMDYTQHNEHSIVLAYLRGEGTLPDGSIDPESRRLASHLVEVWDREAEEERNSETRKPEKGAKAETPDSYPTLSGFLASELTPPIWMPGDILGFKTGHCVHHLGVRLDERHFLHTIKNHGTILGDFHDDKAAKRLHNVFRVLAQP